MTATASGCEVVFVATGDPARIRIPAIEPEGGRYDDLWKMTCFELFWQPEGGTYYREFNLSPSTRWACYDFDDVRVGVRNAPAIVDIGVEVTADQIRLTATIMSALPVPARIALNAIIEHGDGINRYWALTFADGVPEFHSELCRTLRVGA